jgi:hypothetical protein
VLVVQSELDLLFHVVKLETAGELGGGSFEFSPDPSQAGIEGIFTTLEGRKIPISLKRTEKVPNPNVKNIFREIKDNAKTIREKISSNPYLAAHCKLGNEANTIIQLDTPDFTFQEIMAYYESIPPDRRVLLFGGDDVFRQIRIIDKNLSNIAIFTKQ